MSSITANLVALRVAEALRAYARDARRPLEPGEDLESYLAGLAEKLEAQASALEQVAAPARPAERRAVATGDERLWRQS